jgi:glutaredoxin 3
MSQATIYTSQLCGYCYRAKQLLDSKGISYQEHSVDGDMDMRRMLIEKTGQRTVPQIWIGDTHVGGCDDLFALERSGTLNGML